jgi:phosphate transport system substrate-binding protein
LIASQLERAFEDAHPNINLILHVDTDRNCVGHLLMGTADLAMIGSKLSDREKDRGLDTMVLGHRVMVPIVHPENPVHSVSYDDFEAIRSGHLTDWAKIGGKDLRIEPVCMVPPQRPDLAAKSMQFASQAANCTAFLHSHPEILGYVANNVRALGLVSKTSADHVRTVKTLQVDQIMPTLEFYLEGAWRFGSTFRAVHYKEPEANTQSWLEFLKSKPAQVVLKRVMTLKG